MTAAIGCGIAFQGLPDTEKTQFGARTPAIVAIVLGGLYALEKLYQLGSRKDEGDKPEGEK